MGGKTDVVKGRIKEAAGVLTGNDKLREEGKTDQASCPRGNRQGQASHKKSVQVTKESCDASYHRAAESILRT